MAARSSKGARIDPPALGRDESLANNPGALDSIITLSSGGVIHSASDSVEHLFGWKPTELLGRNLSELIPEPRRSALDRYLDRYRRDTRPAVRSRTGRFEAVHKDGRLFSIELSVSRADLPAGSAPFFVGIIRDLSRKIDTGSAPDDERARLHNLITEQTKALVTANLRLHLADRLASLGTLAAGLGHDMNNVLLPVRARLNALEQADIPAPARTHLAAVRESLAYLQRLSDGLHYLVHDEPDAAYEGGGKTDLAHWWGQLGVLLRKAAPKHVRFEASVPAGLPPVTVAPHLLTQAALNLIVNAGESIPASRRRRRGRIRLWARSTADGRAVRLGVTDNGGGMTRHVQSHAFDPFFTTKARSMGTGLGLPLVRKVAERAGGTVELTSVPGKGTTVALLLPFCGPMRGSRRRTAVVSIKDRRTGALVSQVLHEAGLKVIASGDNRPDGSDIWVTEPTDRRLRLARLWRTRARGRSVILVGAPAPRARGGWEDIGAAVVEPAHDFEAMRDAVARAASTAPARALLK